MKNPLGLMVIAVGVVLLIFGFIASDSLSSSFSKFFNGTPSDKAIWLIIGGILTIGVGSLLAWRSSRV